VWKDIIGFEGLYQISNYGRVRSLTRTVVEKTGKSYTLQGRIMKVRVNKKTNYHQACLRKDGKYHYLYIHRLVAQAFLKGEGEEVNHIDCNKGNNYFENLEWCSRLENSNHASKNARFKRGNSHHMTRLKESEVIKIKLLLKDATLTQTEIADRFNTNKSVISDIKRGISWNWLKV